MAVLTRGYEQVLAEAKLKNATLVAVSKTKPVSDILELYDMGHRDFGENYVQELVEKQPQLPADIRWHFIGHLQSNKVKYIAPFVHMIHGVDSYKLLREIDKQGARAGREIRCLLQIHVATEETKFGLSVAELNEFMQSLRQGGVLRYAKVCGLMAMASFTADELQVRGEFRNVKQLFAGLKRENFLDDKEFREISMGMSGDFRIALDEGSSIIRVGSLIFGDR